MGAENSGGSAESRSPGAGAGGLDSGLALAANGSGLAWGTADGLDGGLVLDRGWTLSRHRRIPSLQLSPVVSGRSTGRW